MNSIQADFVVGGVARDDDYYFHTSFIDDLWDSLRKDNVLLLAPRRTGKTSIMYHMLDNPENGYKVIHLNVEEIEEPAEFFLSLIDAINEHQPEYLTKLSASWGLLKNVVSHLDEVSILDFKIKLKNGVDWEKNWKELGNQLMAKVVDADEAVLFIIDELPDMLTAMAEKTPDELKPFLHLFRKMRLDYKGSNNIRWLVGGSVNIRGTLDELGLITLINDLKTEPLPAITAEEISGFVDKMLSDRDVKFDDTLMPKINALLGEPIPFFLQLFTQELFRYYRRNKLVLLTAEHADIVFKHALLGEAAHDKLQHYHSRITMYYPASEQDAAYALLNALAQSSSGIAEKSLFSKFQQLQSTNSEQQSVREMQQAFKRLLLRLESDFYVSKQNSHILDFNSFLLKTWWLKNWVI